MKQDFLEKDAQQNNGNLLVVGCMQKLQIHWCKIDIFLVLGGGLEPIIIWIGGEHAVLWEASRELSRITEPSQG